MPRAGSGSAVATGAADAASDGLAPPAPRRSIDVDFEYGVPDLASFPRRDWAWALTHACRTRPSPTSATRPPGAAPRCARSSPHTSAGPRAAVADAEQVVVCPASATGSPRAPHPAARGRHPRRPRGPRPDRQRRDRPGAAGSSRSPSRSTSEGLDVEALSASGAGVVRGDPGAPVPDRGGAVGPAPPGAGRVGRTDGGVVIEDDYDAEFRYDRQPVGAVQGLAPDRVIAMGSVSKTLAPTLRIGLDGRARPPARRAAAPRSSCSSRGAPGLDQLALAAFVESGRYDKHLRHMRQRLQQPARRPRRLARAVRAGGRGDRALGRLPCGARPDRRVDEHEVVAPLRRAARSPSTAMSRYRLTAPPTRRRSSCWGSAT